MVTYFRMRCLTVLLVLACGACGVEELGQSSRVIQARFDPGEGAIPMPSDLLEDDKTGKLDIPLDDADLTAAEKELYAFINTMDAWPNSTAAKVEFTGALAENSVTEKTVQIWRFDAGKATPYTKGKLSLGSDGKSVSIKPPDEGWPRGSTMMVVVRGGHNGVRGKGGEPVECDAAFYYLRLTRKLTSSVSGFRAFPGATRAERKEAAADLEELRLELNPYFTHLEKQKLPRREVAALWTFTVNKYTEVQMDSAAAKMPLPIDLLLDPKTGKVDLPVKDGDDAKTKETKEGLKELDGFGTTTGQLFEFSASVDPKTVTSGTVQLFKVAKGNTTPIPATVTLAADKVRVEVMPKSLPLATETTYAIVLRPGIRDATGKPVMPMMTGHFLTAKAPLVDSKGVSQVSSVEDEDASRADRVRATMAPLMDSLGRTNVLTAWPFTTLTVNKTLLESLGAAEKVKLPADPKDITKKSALKAALEFPIGLVSMLSVKEVIEGKIATADYLDPATRKRRKEGSYQVNHLPFMLTIPNGAKKDKPLPVVIFGHAICTERRFVLAVANYLAARGFAAIAIDFPYHGSRTHCAWNGPICFPDPFNKGGKMLCPNPCKSGSTCGTDGKCRDKSGKSTGLAKWPILPMYQASGAAFIELASIPGTRHHFLQAIIDLGALSRSLRKGEWKKIAGYGFKTDKIYYLGQSQGGIIGGTYAAIDPYVSRAVLNVPGANLVPMFIDSKYFGTHIDSYLKREAIKKGTAEHQKFLHIAKWYMDSFDPLNVARYLVKDALPGSEAKNSRKVLVQMATLDFIIPNKYTKQLATLADVKRKDYLAEHAFLVIPVEPGYFTGNSDASDFLAGKLYP